MGSNPSPSATSLQSWGASPTDGESTATSWTSVLKALKQGRVLVSRNLLRQHLDHLPSGVVIRWGDEICALESDTRQPLRGVGKKLISVVIPIYREEDIIDELVRRLVGAMTALSAYDYEIIFVNDGSTDQSMPRLIAQQKANPKLRILDLSRNFGHQSAITAGMEFAQGDAVVVIDGDLQDPPEVIAEMVAKWEQGIHVAYGVRLRREGETPFKILTAKAFYRLIRRLSDVDIPVDAGDFRLVDRQVIDQLKALPERSRYIRGLVNWVGFRHEPVMYQRDPRYAGKTKYTLHKMVRFSFDGLTSFSDKPLHLAGYLAMIFALLSVMGVGWVMYGYLFEHDSLVTGWASLMTVMFVLGAVQLLSISIMGLYVGRIYKEARARPNYIIKAVY